MRFALVLLFLLSAVLALCYTGSVVASADGATNELQRRIDELESRHRSETGRLAAKIEELEQELVEVRWRNELLHREWEVEANKPFGQLAYERGASVTTAALTWVREAYLSGTATVLRKSEEARIGMEKLLNRAKAWEQIETSAEQVYNKLHVQFYKSLASGLAWKFRTEKVLVDMLRTILPEEAMPYIDQGVNLVSIAIPAFILAMIWHTVTNWIQNWCSRRLFGSSAGNEKLDDISDNEVSDTDMDSAT